MNHYVLSIMDMQSKNTITSSSYNIDGCMYDEASLYI